jgi:hypothetical protein
VYSLSTTDPLQKAMLAEWLREKELFDFKKDREMAFSCVVGMGFGLTATYFGLYQMAQIASR